MRLPYVHSGTVDLLIASLRAGGYLADDVSADKIRSATAIMDETARDGLAGSLAYGSGGGGTSPSKLSSTDDVWVLVDSDNTNPTTPYTNYFNVIKGQSGTPSTDAHNVLMSLGSRSSTYNTNTLTVGARLDQVLATDTNLSNQIYLGFGGDGAVTYDFGRLYGSKSLFLMYANDLQTGGMSLGAFYGVTLRSDRFVSFANKSGLLTYTRGGFVDLGSTSKFGVGADLYTNPNDHAIAIEKPADDILRIYTSDTAQERPVYFTSQYGPSADNKRVQLCVSAVPGSLGQDPAIQAIGGGYGNGLGSGSGFTHATALFVVNQDRSGARGCGFRVWSRATALPDDTHLVNFDSNIDFGTIGTAKIRMFSITGRLNAGVDRKIAFEVRSDRTCYAYAFSTSGLDIAEAFTVREALPLGTVVVMTASVPGGSSTYAASSSYADHRVVGVVSTKPGMTLGGELDEEFEGIKLAVALAGTVPVRVSTSHGEIERGDLLVSDLAGAAAKAPEVVPPGTVIGKALEGWAGAEEGMVRMLVLNR